MGHIRPPAASTHAQVLLLYTRRHVDVLGTVRATLLRVLSNENVLVRVSFQ